MNAFNNTLLPINQPIQVKNITIKNRIVMAPAVCFGWPCPSGYMSERHLGHYEQRARGNVGMVILQSLLVNNEHPNQNCYAGIYEDGQIGYLAQLANRLHRHGATVIAQLQYDDLTKYRPAKDRHNKLPAKELHRICGLFSQAVKRCRQAGLDGVEIHGAHTYLLNVLASCQANHRQDRYGGSLQGCMQFIQELMDNTSPVRTRDFLFSYRMGWAENEQRDIETAQYLEKCGMDILHISTGIPINRKVEKPEGFAFNSCVYVASRIKAHVGCPVIAVNDIRSCYRGNRLIQDGLTDFVAFGKPLLADADMVRQAAANPQYEPCLKCTKCQWFTNGDTCPAIQKQKRRAEHD